MRRLRGVSKCARPRLRYERKCLWSETGLCGWAGVFVIFVSFDVWFGIFVYFETVRPPCVMTPNETQDLRLRKLSEFAASVLGPFGAFRSVTARELSHRIRCVCHNTQTAVRPPSTAS